MGNCAEAALAGTTKYSEGPRYRISLLYQLRSWELRRNSFFIRLIGKIRKAIQVRGKQSWKKCGFEVQCRFELIEESGLKEWSPGSLSVHSHGDFQWQLFFLPFFLFTLGRSFTLLIFLSFHWRSETTWLIPMGPSSLHKSLMIVREDTVDDYYWLGFS